MTYRTNRKTKGKFKTYNHGMRVVYDNDNGKWYGLDDDMIYDSRPPNTVDVTDWLETRKRLMREVK